MGRLIIWLALLRFVNADTREIITRLPGFDGFLPSNIWTGFLHGGKKDTYDLHYQYLFVEAQVAKPRDAPVLVFTNGGPGAASYFGLFAEIGPFYVSYASLKTEAYRKTGVPTLFLNEHSWSRFANILIMNAPPVGFSHCGDESGGWTSCGKWNDTSVAQGNFNFLESFYKSFPEFQSTSLYLSGESYAGIYIPMLAMEIKKHPESTSFKNLKGMAVGDMCIGTAHKWVSDRAIMAKAQFFFGYGEISPELKQRVEESCKANDETVSPGCKAVGEEIEKQVGGYYAYGLLDECYWNDGRDEAGGYPCGGFATVPLWAMNPTVKAALKVSSRAQYLSGDNAVELPYTQTEPDVTSFILQSAAHDANFRTLIYAGASDIGVGAVATLSWLDQEAKMLQVKESWRPWTLDGNKQTVGHCRRYQGGLDYVAVRGAWHMVPLQKPRAAFEMMNQWINGLEWKRYNYSNSHF
mmetsp:Transcript_16268/g.28057  ORF Transcript_16268/g.28057 Transcript_16268/m.28057 type:complete len:466 (-) Transcript_16268:709-2106(-)